MASHTSDPDHRMEALIGNLLRGGVVLAAAVVAVGGVLFLARYGLDPADHQIFHGEPAPLRSVPGIASEALRFSRRGIIQLGLLLLVATPVVRVAVSAIAFGQKRDWMYLAITLLVLAGLLYSLLGGLVWPCREA